MSVRTHMSKILKVKSNKKYKLNESNFRMARLYSEVWWSGIWVWIVYTDFCYTTIKNNTGFVGY